MLAHRKILVCLDDVWRVEDAKWFIFDNLTAPFETAAECPYKVLITTRVPSLLGGGAVRAHLVRTRSSQAAVDNGWA